MIRMDIKLTRRRFISNKRLQTRFALYFMAAASLGSAVSVVLFNVLGRRRLEAALFSMRIATDDLNAILLHDTLYSCVLPLLVTIIAFLWITKLLFSRLHDPLNRIAVGLHRNRFGRLDAKITLRQNDEFSDVADGVNIMTDELGNRLSRILGHSYLLMEVAKSKPEDQTEALEVSERIDHHVSFLEKELAKFKR